jgi:crotonobetainyl-CoA:carnitine CoA-transferase CaiB-like acyl-CoA transferase
MNDPQVAANGFTAELIGDDGLPFSLIASPVQFDGSPGSPTRAPTFGQHTEELMLEIGMDWEQIAKFKALGALN